MLQVAHRGARIAVKAAHLAVNAAVILAMVLAFAVGVYGLWDNRQISAGAAAERLKAYSPEAEGPGFAELKNLNPDVKGWLEIYGTKIDYPVVKAAHEWDYLNRDVFGNFSLAGSLFYDSKSAADLSTWPTIIYGHHMANNIMFGALDEFSDPAFFAEHQYGTYHYDGHDYGIEILGNIATNAYNVPLYRPTAERAEYSQMILSQLSNRRDIDLASARGLLVFSTCASGSSNARTVVVAAVTDTVHADPFAKEVNKGDGILGGTWFGIPKLAWAGLAFALLALAIVAWRRRRRNGGRAKGPGADASGPSAEAKGTSALKDDGRHANGESGHGDTMDAGGIMTIETTDVRRSADVAGAGTASMETAGAGAPEGALAASAPAARRRGRHSAGALLAVLALALASVVGAPGTAQAAEDGTPRLPVSQTYAWGLLLDTTYCITGIDEPGNNRCFVMTGTADTLVDLVPSDLATADYVVAPRTDLLIEGFKPIGAASCTFEIARDTASGRTAVFVKDPATGAKLDSCNFELAQNPQWRDGILPPPELRKYLPEPTPGPDDISPTPTPSLSESPGPQPSDAPEDREDQQDRPGTATSVSPTASAQGSGGTVAPVAAATPEVTSVRTAGLSRTGAAVGIGLAVAGLSVGLGFALRRRARQQA